ncbi:MAG: hypothetical protein HC774_04560 [Sphingomonadales bacterium]|nr:hypothetical protein [Sphingomonadales bacterium]
MFRVDLLGAQYAPYTFSRRGLFGTPFPLCNAAFDEKLLRLRKFPQIEVVKLRNSRFACASKLTKTAKDRFGRACLTLRRCKVTLALVISHLQQEGLVAATEAA